MTLENKIKWLARFFDLHIHKYIEWEVSTREEDGGAYDLRKSKRIFLEQAIEDMWVQRKMDERVKGVLVYRQNNYPNESDAELGIEAPV